MSDPGTRPPGGSAASRPDEGDGSEAPAQAPNLPRWWRTQPLGLWWTLPLGLGASLWVLMEGQVRLFGYVLAGTLAAGALLRLVLPRDAVGGLMVRSRLWDVVTLLALAAGLAVLSASLKLPE